jgi:hypothetical protein
LPLLLSRPSLLERTNGASSRYVVLIRIDTTPDAVRAATHDELSSIEGFCDKCHSPAHPVDTVTSLGPR